MAADTVRVIRDIEALRQQITIWKQDGDSIALVPTMGNLHAGHLSLVKAANEQASRTIISIFVNPLQFSPDEDFASYPRTFEDDIAKLSDFDVDMVFAPDAGTIYPAGEQVSTFVEVPGLSHIIEGESRPGFFRGVATVVNKLFNLVQPDIACFGEKDYQQLLVIRQMVADLCLPITIHSVATVREANGLAMSSRNNYLQADLREKSGVIYDSLCELRHLLLQGVVYTEAVKQISRQLSDQGFQLDYLTLRDATTLNVPDLSVSIPDRVKTGNESFIILLAVRIEGVRLIDNLLINKP